MYASFSMTDNPLSCSSIWALASVMSTYQVRQPQIKTIQKHALDLGCCCTNWASLVDTLARQMSSGWFFTYSDTSGMVISLITLRDDEQCV
jgi:hypothetical protein